MTEDNPVRVIDVFIDELDLEALGFAGVVPEVTGPPAYHPATLLKIDLVGYIRAYVAALDWLSIQRINWKLSPSSARIFTIFQRILPTSRMRSCCHPTKGFTRRAELDVEGVKTVLELRSEYAEPRKPLGEPVKYYDLQYYDQARAR